MGARGEVDAALVGRRAELVVYPFDLTSVEVRLEGRSMGLAVPGTHLPPHPPEGQARHCGRPGADGHRLPQPVPARRSPGEHRSTPTRSESSYEALLRVGGST